MRDGHARPVREHFRAELDSVEFEAQVLQVPAQVVRGHLVFAGEAVKIAQLFVQSFHAFGVSFEFFQPPA